MAFLQDTAVVQGMSKVGEMLDQLPQNIKEKVAAKATLEAAKIVLTSVQGETPIRTGLLLHYERVAKRNDIPDYQVQYVIFVKSGETRNQRKVRRSHKGASVVPPEYPYYWYFVEFGTHKMAANPFLLRGFTQAAPNAATRARDIAIYWVNQSIGQGKS